MLTQTEINQLKKSKQKERELKEKSKLKTGEIILKVLDEDYLTKEQVKTLKDLIQKNKEKFDPFYSKENQNELRKSIQKADAGQLETHELIEF